MENMGWFARRESGYSQRVGGHGEVVAVLLLLGDCCGRYARHSTGVGGMEESDRRMEYI